MHHEGKETEKLTQTCLLSIIHVCIFPSLLTNNQTTKEKCKLAFKGTSVIKKQKTLFY